jgi:hypothetical protein
MRGRRLLAFLLVLPGHLLLSCCSETLHCTVLAHNPGTKAFPESKCSHESLFALRALRGGASNQVESAQPPTSLHTSSGKCDHPCCKDVNKGAKPALPSPLTPLGSLAILDIARVFGGPVYSASVQTIHGLETGAKWLGEKLTSLWQQDSNVNLEDVQVPEEFEILHMYLQRHKETAGHKEITKTVLRQTSQHMKEMKHMLEEMGSQVEQAKNWIRECQGNKNIRKLRDELQKADPNAQAMQMTSQARIMKCWMKVLHSVNALVEKMKGLVEKSYHIAEEGRLTAVTCREMLRIQDQEIEALCKAIKDAKKRLSPQSDKKQHYKASWDKWIRHSYQYKNDLSELVKCALNDIEAVKKAARKACNDLESLGIMEDTVLDHLEMILKEFDEEKKEEKKRAEERAALHSIL